VIGEEVELVVFVHRFIHGFEGLRSARGKYRLKSKRWSISRQVKNRIYRLLAAPDLEVETRLAAGRGDAGQGDPLRLSTRSIMIG
jgi:hypothetical protein